MSKIGYAEGMQWVTLLAVTGVYGWYFLQIAPGFQGDIGAREIVRFGWYIGLLVVLHIVGAAILAGYFRGRDVDEDERDHSIRARSRVAASYVLGVGVILCMPVAYFIEGHSAVLHAMLGTLVLAQVVESAIQIFCYRRGF